MISANTSSMFRQTFSLRCHKNSPKMLSKIHQESYTKFSKDFGINLPKVFSEIRSLETHRILVMMQNISHDAES